MKHLNVIVLAIGIISFLIPVVFSYIRLNEPMDETVSATLLIIGSALIVISYVWTIIEKSNDIKKNEQ